MTDPRGVSVRDLTSEDLGWVADQEKAIFGASAWSPEVIATDFASGFRRYRGLDIDGALAGYAVYGFDGDAFHLMNIAVRSDARGEGHAHLLMEDFLAEARRLGVGEASLEVAVTNDAALALYRSHGFEDVRVRRRYYQPEGIDALVMRLRVTPASPTDRA
ncbi:MAG TPA: ribosomal protein S18-alanine N-acetyltransferase [Demequinaceae bacterium]